ncbi:MAG TPA: hypothetical protein VM884_04665, partial [Flavisolibacter sp.]|nr:hypothetical protein [Flavisolibacter sp.]
KAGVLTNERDHWITASMRPAGNPLAFLAESLTAALGSSQFIGDEYRLVTQSGPYFSKAIYEKGTQGIVDILLPVFEKSPCNLLLLVDQFEELFTTQRTGADAETQQNENVLFVNILLSLSRQKNLPVYVVITMRSDYIGNCNKFYGLPETLNEGQYLVPRLNRQQLNEVIELPVKLSGEKISARLLDQILNDSDKDLDQLPVLQHALMRTYKFWLQGNDGGVIDFEDYNAAGKLDNALSNHANEVYEKLDDTQKSIAELVFRSLTDVNAENVPIRRRQSLAQLTEVCRSIKNSSMQQVEAVINKFRDRDCSFLTPFSGKLKESTIIDISHESLMRQWDRLIGWMADEQSSGRKFKWLTESVNNRREPLRGIDLKDALAWKLKQPANEEWASRYGGNYAAVETYIDHSKRKEKASKYSRNAIVAIFIIAPLIVFGLINQKERKRLSEKAAMTDSLDHANRKLDKKVIELDSNISRLKQTQQALDSTTKKEKETAAQKAKAELQAAVSRIESERKQREQEQKDKMTKEVADLTRRLKQESFYLALYNKNESFDNGDIVVNALTTAYTKNKSDYNKFYQAITQLFEARGMAEEDPVAALRLLKKARETAKNKIIDDNIMEQVANKMFYKQQIVPVEEIAFDDPTLFLSADKKLFAINDASYRIHTGRVSGDQLAMDENFNYSYVNSFTPEDTSSSLLPPFKTFAAKDNSVLKLEEDGILTSWRNNSKTELGRIPGMDKFKLTEFSPDQNYLVVAPGGCRGSGINDRAMILWSIADVKQNKTPKATVLDSNNTNVKQIVFSPNSRQFFVADNAGLTLYNTGGLKPVPLDNIWAAQFTADGNYLVTIAKTGITDRAGNSRNASISVVDSLGNPTSFSSVWLEPKQLKDITQFTSFSLSPDWRKIMFKQDSKIFILERLLGDSIIRSAASRQFESTLTLNLVYSTTDKTLLRTAAFIDSNSILSVSNKGTISLWKTYPSFVDPDEAFKKIQLPELTIAERLDNSSLTFNDIKSNENEYTLREAVVYYENKMYSSDGMNKNNISVILGNIKMIYKKLIDKTDGAKRLYYIDKLTTLNRDVTNLKSPDSTDQKKMAGQYNENVQLLENQKKNYPTNLELLRQLSRDYNELAYHRIFLKQYAGAIDACKRGLVANPDNKILYTNLALSYLLSKDFTEANKYYHLYKDSSYSGNSFRNGFLQDFDDFEQAGVINKNEKDVYDKVKALREILKAGESDKTKQ